MRYATAIILFAIFMAIMCALTDGITHISYQPNLIHEVICDNQVYEIMIPAGLDEESYAAGFCESI